VWAYVKEEPFSIVPIIHHVIDFRGGNSCRGVCVCARVCGCVCVCQATFRLIVVLPINSINTSIRPLFHALKEGVIEVYDRGIYGIRRVRIEVDRG
jgi:hypothetical protein